MNHTIATAAHPLDTALKAIAPLMADSGDRHNAERLSELRGKLSAGRLTVAFCGHFSAGKSTLVNRLCGTELLPSSPIPTSANVVTIANGEPKATITRLVRGQEETIVVPVDRVNDYCVDGETVQSVSLSYPIPRLGDHTLLLDTPGIDSTDDAHRMATESALHLADVVFYVMDYNHVQSEINFTFAKQLKDWGKPLYLIVNQIDKHRDRELSFEAYMQSVDEAFAGWHLEPGGILYLSLREPDHPHSQWEELEDLLIELSEARAPLSLCSVDASARHLIRMHGEYMEESAEPERERLLAAAGGEGQSERIRSEIAAYESELSGIEAESAGLGTRLRQEMQSLLDNANVTPAPTRELAQSFLESRKPGFKTGLLFAGSKTAAEQERRLHAFRDDFEAQVKAGIEWHLNDLLRKGADAAGWRGEQMEQHLAATVQGTIEPQWLLDHVKAGAVISSEYTMNYCRDLAAAIKSEYRRRAMAMIDTLADRMSAAGEAAAAPLRARLSELAGQARALAQLTALAAEAAAHLARLEALLPPAPSRLVLPKPRAPRSREVFGADFQSATLLAQKNNPDASRGLDEDAAAREFNPNQEEAQGSGLVYMDASTAEPRMGEAEEAAADGGALAPQRLAAERLRRAASLLAPYDALAPAVQAMLDKADRLQSSRFTIALFGAFSAGKSSLANALLGEPVLPVSPNPTTAAVNRIVPPTVENKHGTASVILKTREAVLEDLRYSLSLLGEEPASLSAEELLQKIGKLSPDAIHAGGRPHYSFLKAAAKGWQEQEPLLGRQLIVDGGDYRRYVAEESRSCFVSEIELYHSNPLTEQGIVLVDTPGADSVNARHTGVAFNYIKNADAILFVTYYNHAFSQADRQFLLQLGRVKDQFELDKMFFLVNAADLAADEEELEGVLAHVERNLQQHGIRFPRMFPVSSLQALDAKLAGDHEQLAASGIQAFEQSFLAFTRGDLGNLAVASAEQELDRARLTIAQWVHAASGDAASRERAQQQLSAEAAAARIVAEELEHRQAGSNPQLEQEIRELLFYVQQRVQFRFGDHFNFAFNPAAIQDDGRDLRKALWTSWLELQRLLQIELAQELQATSLRLEHTLNRLAAKKFSDAAAEAANVLQGFAPSPFKPLELPTPEEQPNWQAEAIEPKWLWSRFKSPRHFFEGEGKAALRGALESELAEPLSSWISAAESAWSAEYSRFWEEAMRASAAALRKDIDSFAAGKLSSLSGSTGLSELQHLYSTLKAI